MKIRALSALVVCVVCVVVALPAQAQIEPAARAVAEGVMEAMGGQEAWDNTRHLEWTFFGGRHHYWDKWTGNIRIEFPEGERQGERVPAQLILMNLNSRQGRAWRDGAEITDPEELQGMMDRGWSAWVNDSYWMFMPYKLMDPGVNLTHMGDDIMDDDREAEVLQLTFESVGVTPNNRYLVYVAKDSGLVEQWSHFSNREDPEPRFTMPWTDWQRYGDILLSGSRGREHDWNIKVHDSLPDAVYMDPMYRGS